MNIINNWLEKKGANVINIDAKPILAEHVRQHLLPFLRKFIRPGPGREPDQQLVTELAQLREEVAAAMQKESNVELHDELEIPRGTNIATDFLKEFFKQGVKYLGPLRDSPRPVYQPEALESLTDVGYCGEHTAAVLDLNRERPVLYHCPPLEPSEKDFVTLSSE